MIRRRKIAACLVCVLAMSGFTPRAQATPTDTRIPDKSHPGDIMTLRFEVRDFKALIDDRPPAIVENPLSLRYETSALRINATVRCRVPTGTKFTIGLIQQVDDQSVRADYKRAFTSFELPSVPISDADGTDPPWDGNIHERTTVIGGGDDQDVELATDDNLRGNITWREPLPPDGSRMGPAAELQSVKREQRMTTWLVVRDDKTSKMTVLRKVSWGLRVDISVNPDLPLGSRATVHPVQVQQPVIVTQNAPPEALLTVPSQCLVAPFGNLSQQFWWTPKIKGIGTRTRLQ